MHLGSLETNQTIRCPQLSMVPVRRAPSPSSDLPSPHAAKRARTCGVPVPSPEPSPAAEAVSPQAAKDVVQHCGGHPSDTAAPEQPKSELLTRTVTLRLGPAHSTHGPSAATTSPRTQRSLMFLEREMHDVWLKIGQKEMEGKGTGKCYPRQVRNYRVWFEEEQSRIAASDPSRTALPAFPITAAKVAAFLHNESTREKVSLACALSLPATSPSGLVSCSSSGEAGPRRSRAPRWASPTSRRSSMPWRTTGSIMSTSIPETTRPESVSGRTCGSTRSSQPRSTMSRAGSRSPRQSKLLGPPLVCHLGLPPPPLS